MRLITILISAILLALIATRVLASEVKPKSKTTKGAIHTCHIVTGYGTADGQGASPLEALENARFKCGTAMIDDYLSRRREIPEDVKVDLALSCTSLECT